MKKSTLSRSHNTRIERNSVTEGQLKLELVDVFGNRIGQSVDLLFQNLQVAERRVVRRMPSSEVILVRGLRGAPQGLYCLEVDSPSYLPISQFVSLASDHSTDLRLSLAVNSRKIQSIQFPDFPQLSKELQLLLKRSDRVLSFERKVGAALFQALDDIRKGGLLNIAAKTEATLLGNGKPVLGYFKQLLELRGDRFFVMASKELREETKNSVAAGLFHIVDSSLHHPPEGYSPAGSFKTEDRYGGLQLTFFMNSDECVVDVDIDDASGIEHLFQVLRNAISHRQTNPFDIHQILVYYQKIDPGYRLIV